MLENPPASNPPEIIGYVDPWIASPGSTINVKVNHQKKLTNLLPPFDMPQKCSIELRLSFISRQWSNQY
jgi:hypothetical protein